MAEIVAPSSAPGILRAIMMRRARHSPATAPQYAAVVVEQVLILEGQAAVAAEADAALQR